MNKFFSILSVLAISLLLFAGCLKDQTQEPQPCTYDSCAFKASASEIAAVQAYIDSAGVTGTTQHCSGLFYKLENPGTGLTPEACSAVNAKYKGMLTNGNVFDSSLVGADLALDQVIRGWRNGLPLVKEGGRILLYVPPALGWGAAAQYNRNGVVVIPANSITVFEVDLVKVY